MKERLIDGNYNYIAFINRSLGYDYVQSANVWSSGGAVKAVCDEAEVCTYCFAQINPKALLGLHCILESQKL